MPVGDINIGGNIDLEVCTQSHIQLSGGGLTNHHKSVSAWEHQGWCEQPSEINQGDLMQPSSLLFQDFVLFTHYLYSIMFQEFDCSSQEKLNMRKLQCSDLVHIFFNASTSIDSTD